MSGTLSGGEGPPSLYHGQLPTTSHHTFDYYHFTLAYGPHLALLALESSQDSCASQFAKGVLVRSFPP